MLLFIRVLGWCVAAAPEALVRMLAHALGDLLFIALPSRRRLVLSNLSHAFPDRPHAWLRRTARASCRQMMETGLLGLASPFFSRERFRRLARPSAGFHDAVVALTAPGRPIVAGLPHLGAWEVSAGLPAIYDGKLPVIGCAYRPLDHAALDDYVRRSRERFGARMLSRKEGFSEGMQILRDGGVFCLLFDQSAGDRGELTLFFDRVCSSTNLPGLMVEKFDAQLGMFFVRRLGFWRYELELHAAPDAPRDSDGVTVYLDRWLERLLRSDETLCASWLWLHNRWKTQVKPERRFRLAHKKSLLPPPPLPRRTRFFVRLPNWLGDVVMALPLLRALRESRPDAAITAIVKPALAPLLERSGLCEAIIPLPPRGWGYFRFFRRLRRLYPDCWVTFTNSTRGDLEAWCARAPQRFGMARPGRRRPLLTHAWRLPRVLNETHEHQLRVWEKYFRHFGLDGEVSLAPIALRELPGPLRAPEISRGADSHPAWIGLIAGTENFPAKRWPVAHWRALIEQLSAAEPQLRFALFGTPSDQAITREIAAGFPAERVRDLAGKTGLLEFAGALAECRLVIANDTGGMHLANLLGAPLIALFGPTNPVRTGPIFGGAVTILQPPNCAPTGGGSLAELTPDAVAQTARQMLDQSVDSHL